MDKAVTSAVQIRELSTPVKASIASVGAIAGNRDCDYIAEAMIRSGKDGAITIEEQAGTGTTVEIVKRMQFADKGFHCRLTCNRPRAHGSCAR